MLAIYYFLNCFGTCRCCLEARTPSATAFGSNKFHQLMITSILGIALRVYFECCTSAA